MRDRSRRPTRDESRLWRTVTADVRPLARSCPPAAATEEEAPSPQRVAPAPRTVPAPSPPPSARPTVLPPLAHGTVAGLDRRTARRLRRGQLPVDARIDLHGMTQAEAHRALTAFVAGQQAAGRRCVLVITGKGSAKGRAGILRAAVPRWLNEPPNRERVLAFDFARPRDGGEGALYVLLRRLRRDDP